MGTVIPPPLGLRWNLTTVGGNITVNQGSGSGDTATVLDVTVGGNITILQGDVAGNATGDTASVIGVTAGSSTGSPFLIEVGGIVTITQGNAPGDVAYLDGDHINNVSITQGDNVQALNGSTVVSDVAEINDTSVTSNVTIMQGTGTSTAINAGNYVAAIGFDYLGYINGTPASSSVTVGGDTYIDQNYANNQVFLGDSRLLIHHHLPGCLHRQRWWRIRLRREHDRLLRVSHSTPTPSTAAGPAIPTYDGGNTGVTVDPANFNTATVNASFWALLTPVLTWAEPRRHHLRHRTDGTQLDATANTPGTFTYTLAAGTVLHAGQQTLSVQFTPTDTTDYTDATATAVINVTPAPLTVTANNASKIYGAALPTLTASYTGFVNGDTSASLTTQPTLGTTATAASPVGTYAITASGAVDGDYSITYANGTLTVTQAPLTITANNATKVYGQANPALTGTISGLVNGDTDIATYTTTATASSGVGTYAITPSLSDSNYNITFNNGTLTVTQATPVITWANPADITYGTPLSSTQLDATANIPGTFTYTSASGTVLHAGQGQTLSVLFTPTDTTDYTSVQATATINVTPAPLTITANGATKVYGAALPPLTVSYSGFVNGDTSASLTTQPTLGTTATAASPVGTYAITASGAVDGDYSITYANGTLTVTQAPLTITANNATKVYGQANPALTGTISGLVNGDTDIATYTTTATASSGVGTYAITPSLSDSNYNITFNNGTLTVTQATPVITWANPADITYGTPLSSTQLDATANIPGTFTYTSALGTVLSAGANETLSVRFTPTDTTDYGPVPATADDQRQSGDTLDHGQLCHQGLWPAKPRLHRHLRRAHQRRLTLVSRRVPPLQHSGDRLEPCQHVFRCPGRPHVAELCHHFRGRQTRGHSRPPDDHSQ